MMVLLVAAEFADTPHAGSDDPTLVFGLGNWGAFFDAGKLKPAETEFNLGFVPEFWNGCVTYAPLVLAAAKAERDD